MCIIASQVCYLLALGRATASYVQVWYIIDNTHRTVVFRVLGSSE